MSWQPGKTLKDTEREDILEAYRFYGENQATTAHALDISVKTLYNKLVQYGRIKPASGLEIHLDKPPQTPPKTTPEVPSPGSTIKGEKSNVGTGNANRPIKSASA